MKKVLILTFVALFSFNYAVNAKDSKLEIIAKAIDIAEVVYSFIPNAEYTVEVKADGEVGYFKAPSANEIILKTIVSLENGADYAHIRSTYPTVHSACRDKRYTKADIEYLKSKL